jgi:hypothetical protein
MRNHCLVKAPLLLLISSLSVAGNTLRQVPVRKATPPALVFEARPARPLFRRGDVVVLVLSIRNESAGLIFVSRLTDEEFVDFKINGPDGKEVPWRGKGRIDSKQYSSSDFAVLKSGQKISAGRIISLKDGEGFIFTKPGRYSVAAEYSLGPPEYFAPLAGDTNIPTGSFRSMKATFCVDVCDPASEKQQ